MFEFASRVGEPRHELNVNGVMIVRTPTGIAVGTDGDPRSCDRVLLIEVEHQGRKLKADFIAWCGPPWRDYFPGIAMLQVGIRVKEGTQVLAELKAPNAPMAFMVLQGEQHHITEDYVAVPPALTITDERGDVWTMGFQTASKEQSPAGEFAFNVLRNGIDVGEIASRIERRRGQVSIFTREGWKNWNGQFFF